MRECVNCKYSGELLDTINDLHKENEALKLDKQLLIEELRDIADRAFIYCKIMEMQNEM